MSRLKDVWGELGGKLGILLCLAGFVALFMGWNGAASYDRVPAQFPYLISGGIVGLGFIVIGASMIVVDANRQGRDELQASLVELRQTLELLGSGAGTSATSPLDVPAGTVVAGASSYHRPTCHLVAGRANLVMIPAEEADADGLAPCRICSPDG